MMELTTLATVSNAHLDEESVKQLDQKFTHKNEHPDPNHWSNDLSWACHDYGWILSLNGERFNSDSPEFTQIDQYPACLRDIILSCRRRGVRWINFDQDGPEIKEVKTYNW